jgi:hypothetical protein
MAFARTFVGLGCALVAATALLTSSPTAAQQAGQTPQGQAQQGRDCQTVRTCNFTRTGDVRGCLSSYTCRSCRMVTIKCTLPNTGACREMRCDWGG